jgi:hypothetical protein
MQKEWRFGGKKQSCFNHILNIFESSCKDSPVITTHRTDMPPFPEIFEQRPAGFAGPAAGVGGEGKKLQP